MQMKFGLIFRVLGALSLGTGAFMLVAVPWALYFGEFASIGHFGVSVALCGVAGALLLYLGRNAGKEFEQREALLLVGVGWAWVAFLGAIPLVVGGELGPIDAYFEIMSGFTTTGSSVMVNLDSAPRSLVFWRNFTHWLGGLGIVLLLIAVLPYLGTGGKMLVRRESTGPDPRGIRPRVRETARLLYRIYLGLTLLGVLAYMVAGMNFYEALNHCFSALATGGFSTRYNSLADYNSIPIELVSILMMLLGGTNFALYFQMWQGDWKAPLRDTEFKVYMGIFLGAVLLVTLNLVGFGGHVDHVELNEQAGPMLADHLENDNGIPVPRTQYPVPHALRMAAITVSTMMTDTGFVADNYDKWPYFSRLLLMVITMTGGCVGSTAGGLKIIRVILLAKMIGLWLQRAYRPHLVRAIRFNDQVIDDDIQRRIFAFFTLYVAWMFFAMLVVSAFGIPLDTAFSAVIATMNNCGPGLEFVGPAADFSMMPAGLKLFLSFNMLVGRLELVTVLALFTPTFWRSY